MTIVMVLGAALQFGSPREGFEAVLLVAVVALLPVAALMTRQVRKGSWTHVDASRPAERPLLFAVCIVALAILVGIVFVLQPGSLFVRGAIGVLAMLCFCAMVTKWGKVSLHMAFAALAAATLLSVGSPVGWVLVALLPALAWSRLTLKRHRPAEVVVGLLIGLGAGYRRLAIHPLAAASRSGSAWLLPHYIDARGNESVLLNEKPAEAGLVHGHE